jgi:hypothetical protein
VAAIAALPQLEQEPGSIQTLDTMQIVYLG